MVVPTTNNEISTKSIISPRGVPRSSVKTVPFAELCSVNVFELLTCHAVSPVTVALTGSVEARITSVEQQVLNGEYQQSRVACKHRSHYSVVAVIPISARVSAIGKKLSAGFFIDLPNVSEQGVIVVCSRVGNTVVFVVVG